MRGATQIATGLVAVSGLLALTTPWVVSDVAPFHVGGWETIGGALAPFVTCLEVGIPLATACALLGTPGRSGAQSGSSDATRQAVALGIALPLLVFFVTHVLAPELSVAVPRLGTASIVLFGGGLWLDSFREGRGGISDSGFARAILDDLPDGVALLDRQGHIRAVNESLAALVGVDQADLAGRPIEDIIDLPATDLADRVDEREASLLCANGGESLPVAVSSAQLYDRKGGTIGGLVVARDMRPVMHLRRQVVVSGRLAAVGELAAGIAHEVNNPIAYIQANLNLLCRDHAGLEKALSEALESGAIRSPLFGRGFDPTKASLKNIARVAAIVRAVQGFAHAGSGERRPFDVAELLRDVLGLASLRLGAEVAVSCDFAELPPVVGSGQDLKQVFLSLIRRAVSGVEGGGRVSLTTRAQGDRVVVVVEGEGETCSPGRLERRQRPPRDPVTDEWRGLELVLCKQIIEQQGGDLAVELLAQGASRVFVTLATGTADA
jgi:PAS domain S-box-containing protein